MIAKAESLLQKGLFMVIGILGESCTRKSTLAEKIAASFPCEVFTGKDYLRLQDFVMSFCARFFQRYSR